MKDLVKRIVIQDLLWRYVNQFGWVSQDIFELSLFNDLVDGKDDLYFYDQNKHYLYQFDNLLKSLA